MIRQLLHLGEPSLIFGYGQAMEDPRDGLALFGPLDQGKQYGIRAGVVGTSEGIERFRRWVAQIQGPVAGNPPMRRGQVVADEATWERAHPSFPGFEAVFAIPWKPEPALSLEVPAEEVAQAALIGSDAAQRVYRTVDVYASRIIRALQEEETTVDVWFIVIPEIVYKYCRPKASVPADIATTIADKGYGGYLKKFIGAPSLFEEDNVAAIPYQLDLDFHHQLKGRLLDHHVATQIVRETTIAHRDFLRPSGSPVRALNGLEPDIAWHIAAAAFYKLGGRPWKLAGVREGVCYIGLVFKRDHTSADDKAACCAAQMFLDSGDGLVFKGDIGPWYTPATKQYHISRVSAKELVAKAVDSYKDRCGSPPRELFIHGRARFDDEEWAGFSDAVARYRTTIVGIRIREARDIKLYRMADRPVLRGLAYLRDQRTAFLWTKGYTPRLATYVGREVPNPLLIDVCRGKAPMTTVLKDILGLTKINYNACRFADGPPVTLKFADQIGEILTAGFSHKDPPLQFRYYI